MSALPLPHAVTDDGKLMLTAVLQRWKRGCANWAGFERVAKPLQPLKG